MKFKFTIRAAMMAMLVICVLLAVRHQMEGAKLRVAEHHFLALTDGYAAITKQLPKKFATQSIALSRGQQLARKIDDGSRNIGICLRRLASLDTCGGNERLLLRRFQKPILAFQTSYLPMIRWPHYRPTTPNLNLGGFTNCEGT